MAAGLTRTRRRSGRRRKCLIIESFTLNPSYYELNRLIQIATLSGGRLGVRSTRYRGRAPTGDAPEKKCCFISLNPDALSPCNILSAFRLSSPFFAEAQHSKRKLLLLTLATFQCSKQTVSRVKGQRWQNGMYLSRYIKEVVQQNEDSSSSELSDNSEDGVYRRLFDDDQTDTAVRSFNSIPYDVLCIGDSNLLIRRGLLDSLWAGYIGLARKWTESAVKH